MGNPNIRLPDSPGPVPGPGEELRAAGYPAPVWGEILQPILRGCLTNPAELPAYPPIQAVSCSCHLHTSIDMPGRDVCERGRDQRSAWRGGGLRGANSLVSIRLSIHLCDVSATRDREPCLSPTLTRAHKATRNGIYGVVQAAALACACQVRGVGSRTRGPIGCHLRCSVRAISCSAHMHGPRGE